MASHHPSRSGALLHAKQSPDVHSRKSASRTQVGWCLQIGQVLIACLPVTMRKPLPPRLAGFWPCHSARFFDSVAHSGDFLQKNDSTLCSALLLLPLLILNLSRQCQSGHAERLPIPTCKKKISRGQTVSTEMQYRYSPRSRLASHHPSLNSATLLHKSQRINWCPLLHNRLAPKSQLVSEICTVVHVCLPPSITLWLLPCHPPSCTSARATSNRLTCLHSWGNR